MGSKHVFHFVVLLEHMSATEMINDIKLLVSSECLQYMFVFSAKAI
jgi:hypothetical protein